MATISTLTQVIQVEDVGRVVVMDIAEFEGEFIREIRIFPGPEGDPAPATLIVRVTGDTEDAVQIKTPVLEF